MTTSEEKRAADKLAETIAHECAAVINRHSAALQGPGTASVVPDALCALLASTLIGNYSPEGVPLLLKLTQRRLASMVETGMETLTAIKAAAAQAAKGADHATP